MYAACLNTQCIAFLAANRQAYQCAVVTAVSIYLKCNDPSMFFITMLACHMQINIGRLLLCIECVMPAKCSQLGHCI